MAVLRAKKRNALKSSQFGLPGQRKYPMPDKSHARNAKARASEMEHAGRLSKAQESSIDAKADRVLGKSKDPKEKPEMRKKTEEKKKPEHKGKAHHMHEAERHERLKKHHAKMEKHHKSMAGGAGFSSKQADNAGKDGENDKFSKGRNRVKPPLKHGAAAASPSAEWGNAKRVSGTAGREGM